MSFLGTLLRGARRAEARDLERRLDVLRGELAAARASGDPAVIIAIRDRLPALNLTDDDAALELEVVDGLLEVAALVEAAGRGESLPSVPTTHRALGGETCHFLAPAWRPDVAGDGGGKLLFTPRRLLYLGASPVTLSWAHVSRVVDQGPDLVVRARPDRVLTFRCNSHVDTLRGAWLARQLSRTG
jgi:hypothetical protein